MFGHLIKYHSQRLFSAKYQIAGVCSEGPHSVVYQGVDPLNGEKVAIKVTKTENEGISNNFAKEKRALSIISNPHIPRILDFGRYFGKNVLVIKYFEGRTLEELHTRRFYINPEGVRRIALQLISALEATHGVGIVHGDIFCYKNILIGQPPYYPTLLLDFEGCRFCGPCERHFM